MPQAWKITRSQISLFRPEPRWRTSLRTLISAFSAVFWAAAVLWLVTGGAEARQTLTGIFRSLARMVRDALSGLPPLFR
jgi:hypothetical protein